jgi:hypothetical protein
VGGRAAAQREPEHPHRAIEGSVITPGAKRDQEVLRDRQIARSTTRRACRVESGQEDDLDALCDRIGVPRRERTSSMHPDGLNQQFGEGRATQELNQDHTRFEQLLAEADPRSDVGRERQRVLAEGRGGDRGGGAGDRGASRVSRPAPVGRLTGRPARR